MPNYAFTTGRVLPEVGNGHVFERINFMQMLPHTKIFEGKTGLVFRNCNLLNCDVPPDAKVESCLRVHKSFCSHVHPEWVEKGLPECEEMCEHLVDTDEIYVNGVLLDTIRHYADKEVV